MKRNDRIRLDVFPPFSQATGPDDHNLQSRCRTAQSEMHANVAGTQIAAISVSATPERCMPLPQNSDAGADSIPVALDALQPNHQPMILVCNLVKD
jgi:hypothetical protein